MKRYIYSTSYQSKFNNSGVTLSQVISILSDKEIISINANSGQLYGGAVRDLFTEGSSKFITTRNFSTDELDEMLDSQVIRITSSSAFGIVLEIDY